MNPRPRTRKGPRGAFAETIRDAREVLHLTQEQAAEAVGCHRVTWAAWETGSKKPSAFARKAVETWIRSEKAKKGGHDA